MNFWQLYWIIKLDIIYAIINVFWVVTFIKLLMKERIEVKKFISLKTKNLILTLLIIFAPSTRDLLTIYSAQWATNSAEVKKLPDTTVKAMNKLLEDYIKKESK